MRNSRLASLLVFVLVVLFVSVGAFAQVIVVRFAPPALPVYEQPQCPAENYMWVPGYWGWDPNFDDYFWVPGTWVLAPESGYLWTPGYWGWNGSGYLFHEGYWAPEVGYYGGINYGYGYFGEGYQGGRWDHDHFYYNRAVNNVNVNNIHNVYNANVVNRRVNRVSYNGGPGGINARPNAQQQEPPPRRLPPVEAQNQHRQTASSNRQLRASVNQGKPPIAATQKPAAFSGGSVVPAKQAGAPYHPPANRAANQPNGDQEPHAQNQPPNYAHAKDVPPHPQPAAPAPGDAQSQQQYQQQQQLHEQQQREHEQMAQQQEREHQQAQQQHANQAQVQQMEREHQQQTQRMEQQHAQQMQQMQGRGEPPEHAMAPPQQHGAPAPHNEPPK